MKAPTTSLIAAGSAILLSAGGGVVLTWPVLEQATIAAYAAARPPSGLPANLRQKGWDFWTIEIENLSNELKEERLRLRKQLEGLEQRSARQAAEEKELARVRTELEAMRRQIADRVVEIAADEARNIRSLASTYSSLSPRAAVAIFREMDDVTVVKILANMKPDVVGPIFEEMSRGSAPEDALARRAAMLSEKLRLMKNARPAS